MVHRISNILSRFPEDEKAVRALIHESGELEALCEEYAKIGRVLEHLGPTKPDAIVGDNLQKRRIALEEEILARIEGYTPT